MQTLQISFGNAAEVTHQLVPGWYTVLRRLATLDRPPLDAKWDRPIAAVAWPQHSRPGWSNPPSRNREIIRPGLTPRQCLSRGASPETLRRAMRLGYIQLEVWS